jgi:hypothetical protein
MYPDGNEYLFEGYNAADVPDPVEPPFSDNPFAYLEQGYYNLGDDIPPTAEWEEELLIEFYGDYYTSGEFLRDGLTRDNLLDDAFEYIDYNNSFGYSGYNYGGYGYGAYSAYCEEYNNVGKEPPTHSIECPVNIKMQQGPKCSAYSSSCLLRYYGKDIDTDKLYRSFMKLPDGSAVPSSVARKIKAKIHTRGKVSDIEKQIDDKKPVLVLIYYDKTPGWDNLHYVLVTGYDDEYIYIADSLHGSGERYYNRAVKRDVFEVMWNTSKSFPVRLFYGKNIWYEYDTDTKQ